MLKDKIKILAVDPSLRNFGMARFVYDMATAELDLRWMSLIVTEKDQDKKIRRNSDDLKRAQTIYASLWKEALTADFVMAEIPSGAQSARAAYGFGMMVGLLAGCQKPIIQVMPSETKVAAVGRKTASKEEIINWAVEKYPNGDWIRIKRKGEMVLTDANEHLADACAIAEAGIMTDEFQRVVAIYKSAA